MHSTNLHFTYFYLHAPLPQACSYRSEACILYVRFTACVFDVGDEETQAVDSTIFTSRPVGEGAAKAYMTEVSVDRSDAVNRYSSTTWVSCCVVKPLPGDAFCYHSSVAENFLIVIFPCSHLCMEMQWFNVILYCWGSGVAGCRETWQTFPRVHPGAVSGHRQGWKPPKSWWYFCLYGGSVLLKWATPWNVKYSLFCYILVF